MIPKSIMSVAICAAIVSTAAIAQQVIYPAKGQSAKQQKKDESECYTWAKGQTGYDPAAPQQAAAPSKPLGGGIAKGAVAGAAIGGIGGNDVGSAAAKGAVVGGVARYARNRGGNNRRASNSNNSNKIFSVPMEPALKAVVTPSSKGWALTDFAEHISLAESDHAATALAVTVPS